MSRNHPMFFRKLAVGLVGLAFLAAASVGCSGKDPGAVSGAQTGSGPGNGSAASSSAADGSGADGSDADTQLAGDNRAPDTTGGARVTFIELGSDSCVPCIMMREVMDEIERLYGDRVRIVFYDVWTEAGKPYAHQYNIRVIPTQVFLDSEGVEFYRHEGYLPLEEAAEILSRQGVERRR